MRIETVIAWIFVGFGLLMLGTLLYIGSVYGGLGRFLAVVGAVYFGIGVVLTLMHDHHMDKRTQAGRE
jgi:hypothetical protein